MLNKLEKKINLPSKRTGYTLPRGMNETTDINLLLKSLLPKEVKK